MLINLDTATASTSELTALIALLASLGGRLPSVHTETVRIEVDASGAIEELGRLDRAAPPPPASEALIAQAVAERVDTDEGPAVDPTTLDADGIPWDARIHASTKSQNKDGTWKKLRNVNEVLYGEVHAELQAAHARPNAGTGTTNEAAGPNGSDIATNAAPPPPATERTAPPPPVAESPKDQPEASAPTAPPPPADTAAASATGVGRFDSFPAFVSAVNAISSPSIPYLKLNETAGQLGIAAFKDMKDRPDLWEDFYALSGGQ